MPRPGPPLCCLYSGAVSYTHLDVYKRQGITTFNALRNGPAKAGDLVAVLGIGGLGHLGVQYARHMGFEVVAIGRGAEKEELALKLGAHHYIDLSLIHI